MEKNYLIVVGVDISFGIFKKLEYTNREIANAVWKEFHSQGTPTITVHGNSFKVHDVTLKGQPIKMDVKDWPDWAINSWKTKRKLHAEYLGGCALNYEDLGCCEFHERTATTEGMTAHERTFFTYSGEILFSVCEYD